MVERTIRVSLVGDATSLVAAANQARTALMGLSNVNLGAVKGGISATGQAAQQATQQTSAWGNSLRTGLSVVGIQAGVAGIVGGFKSIMTAGLEFQGNLNTLRAVTGASNAEMIQLSDTAKRLGADITIPGASSADAAEGMKELAKGGFSVQQSMDAARGSLLLATAAQVSAGQAASIQARTLNAFRLSADQAGKVADVLAAASNAATGEITDLAMGMQQSATVAAGFGINVTDTATTLALFAKNGVIGSDAGTSFKTMLTQLASPTKHQVEAMEDLNLVIYDAAGTFVGMESVTEQLSTAHTKLTQEQYNTAAATLFGTDALRAANILGIEGTKGWEDMADKVGKEGAAAELAAAQMVGLNGALDRISNVVASASTALFEDLQPAMVLVVDAARVMFEVFSAMAGMFFSLPAPILAAVGVFAAWLLLGPKITLMVKTWGFVLGLLMENLTLTTTAAGTASISFRTLGVAATAAGTAIKTAFLSNPIGIALSVIAAGLALFIGNTEDATEAQADLGDVIDENTGKLKDNAVDLALADEENRKNAQTYELLGGNVDDWTAALLGNEEAQARVHTLILQATMAQLELSGAYQNAVTVGLIPATMSLSDYATGVLNGTLANNYMNDSTRALIDLDQKYAHSEATVTDAIAKGTETQRQRDRVQQNLSRSTNQMAQDSKEVAKAINDVYDEMGNARPSIAFKHNVDAARRTIEEADLAAQNLTISLLGIHGNSVSAAQAQRANAAAMRLLASSGRVRAAALADEAEAERDLQQLREYGTNSPGAVEDAEKEAQKAAAGITEAQQEVARASRDAADSVRQAQEDLNRAVSDGIRAQEDAQRDLADAERKLAEANADPKTTYDQMVSAVRGVEDARRKVQDTAVRSADAVKDAQDRVGKASQSAADQQEDAARRVVDAQEAAAEAEADLQQTREDGIASSEDLAAADRDIADAKDSVADAADAQMDAMDKAAQSARDMAAAAYAVKAAEGDIPGGIAAANAVMEEQRGLFIAAGIEADIAETAIIEYADQQGLIPDEVTKYFELAGIEAAIILAQELNAALNEIPGRKEYVFVALGDDVVKLKAQEVQDAINKGRILHPTSNEDPLAGKYDPAQQYLRNKSPLTPYWVPDYEYGYGPGDLHAAGGPIFGPGGPTDDVIPAMLSAGEFVVNAKQAQKHRALLEAINAGTQGFRLGGSVGTGTYVGATTAFGILLQGKVAIPDVPTIAKAWKQIGDAIRLTWIGLIDPTLDDMDESVLTSADMMLALDTVSKLVWANVGTVINKTVVRLILPTYGDLNLGTAKVGLGMVDLYTDRVAPSWLGISTVIVKSYTDAIFPTYQRLALNSVQLGQGMVELFTRQVTPSWMGISSVIVKSWVDAIEPTFRRMVEGVTGLGKVFQVVAQLIGITWQTIKQATAEPINWIIDKVWNTGVIPMWAKIKAWVPTVTATLEPLPGLTLADGGPVRGPGGPRDDMVPAYLSNGEYVVNARSTAANRDLLDRINARRYADGGLVDLWSKIPNVAGGVAGSAGGIGGIGAGALPDQAGVFNAAFLTNPYDTVMSMMPGAGEAVAQNAKGGFGQVVAGLAGMIVGTAISAVKKALGLPDDGTGGPAGLGGVTYDGQLMVGGYTVPLPTGARGLFLKAVASQMGTQYLWGGASPPLFDCSGLMSWALMEAGVGKGRLTAEGFNRGFPKVPSPGKPGDMATFDTGRIPGGAGHIGAILDPLRGLMMHTDGAGPARVGDYKSRDGGPLNIVDPIGGALAFGVPSALMAFSGDISSAPLPSGFGATRMMNTVDPVIDHGAMNMSRGTAAMVGALPPGDAINRWGPLYTHAMTMLGMYTPAGHAKMMYQMFRESSGNPLSYAIDSNYYNGHPSKGLLQTIPSTFKNNAPPGYNTNIWDPLSNALASLRYIKNPLSYPGGAYDSGGYIPPGLSTVYNGLGAPEPVLTNQQWAIASRAMNYMVNGTMTGNGPIDVQITFAGDGAITNAMAQTARVTVNGALVETARVLATSRGQA